MQVFGYVRVSTEEQAKSGVSLDARQQQITGYSMMKGWSVNECFVESAVSGSVPLADRPEGQRLLDRLQPGDVVITATLDRMFRSASDALGTLEAIKEQGVALHMIDLGGDVTGSGISKLVFTILAASRAHPRSEATSKIARDIQRRPAPVWLRCHRWRVWFLPQGQVVSTSCMSVCVSSAWPTRSCENLSPLHLGLGFRIFETTMALWLGRPSAWMETFLTMSRGVQPFTKHQLANAMEVVVKAGVQNWRMEFTDGKRKLVVTGGAAPPGAPDAKDDGNPWDDVK